MLKIIKEHQVKSSKPKVKNISKSKIVSELQEVIKKYMLLKGFDESDIKDYTNIDINDRYDGLLKITVGAELRYESMEELAALLDKVIVKYDNDAYFDQEDAGLMGTLLYDVKLTESKGEPIIPEGFKELQHGIPGYYLYRKFESGMKKAEWLARAYDSNKFIPITYAQARGEEPIDPKEKPIHDLRKFVSKKLGLSEANQMSPEEMEEVGIREVMLKDVKKGDYFTLRPISEPKESQVYKKEDYDKSSKKFWCSKFSNISDGREFPGTKKVYVDFTF